MSPLCRIATNETAADNDATCLVVVEGKEIPKRGRELRLWSQNQNKGLRVEGSETLQGIRKG